MAYENLEVYKRAFRLGVEIHRFSLLWPKIEQYGGLADQIRRSSKSICANLAEGLSKLMSAADERRFISMALGSAEEVRVWLSFAKELDYLAMEDVSRLRAEYLEISRMLYGLLEKRLQQK